MFAHSATLISRFVHFIFKTDGFGQLLSFSRVNGSFSTAARLLILSSDFSYSLTKLQNCSLCEPPINSFEVPKSGKTTTAKQINKSLKKHHRYIYWVSHWLCKIQSPPAPWAPKRNSKFKTLLVQIFSLKTTTTKKIKYFQLLLQKRSNFFPPRKQSVVPLDKGLQWVNVKQKIFRQIQTHPRIIQEYSEPCITLTYLKLRYVQNPDTFRTRRIFRTAAYLQLWYIQKFAIFKMLAYSKSGDDYSRL